ncbi:hypothetical protein C8R46DRAFT_1036416 [Mycena filopes]|nr:hypothetical protein C8R46DRAFT_1036416 [Mycena filopes]
MAAQFTSVPTKYSVRPLLSAPPPVTLPILLTNLVPEGYPLPRMLIDIDPDRTPSPPPSVPGPPPGGPPRAHTPAAAPRSRAPTPAPAPTRAQTPVQPRRDLTPQSRDSSLTPMEEDDNDGEENSSGITESSKKITRPSGANIQSVKALLKLRHADLSETDQNQKYLDFRARLDTLCGQYLRPSVALTYQDKEQTQKVYDKMTSTYPWLAEYQSYWPAAICLQGKLHNSAARAIDKSSRKTLALLTAAAPRASSRKKL